MLASVVVGLCAVSVYAQDQATTGPGAPQPPAAGVIELNKALKAYHDGDFEDARSILERLKEREPDNLTCLYYLGLILLQQGLDESRAGNKDAAQEAFSEARDLFETVLGRARKEDPKLVPVEAALDLGIAQLASDDVDPSRQVELASKAMSTLEAYTRDTPGRDDRLGHFFLGIAYYRLDMDDPAARGYRNRAARSFRTALNLARADLAAKRHQMDEEAFRVFENRVKYYQGLIAARRDRKAAAIALLQDVADTTTDEIFKGNAAGLVDFLEAEQKRSPAPMSLDSPLGPLWIEGGVTIGQQFDSNVILLGEDTSLPLGIGREYDYRFGLQADFDVSRTLTRHDDGLPLGESLLIGVGGDVFNLWQPSIGEFDINTYRARVYVNWELYKDTFLGVEYDYSYTLLGHEPFISSNRLTPVFSYIWRETPTEPGEPAEERARTDVYYSFEYRDYFDEISRPGFDRDGAYHAAGVTQSFNLWQALELWPDYYAGAEHEAADARRWFILRLGYVYRNERTQGDEFDLFGSTVFAGAEIPLPYRLAFDFRGEFTWDSYTQPSFIDFRRNERSDFIQRYVFGLSRVLVAPGENPSMPSLSIRARAGAELTYQDSNVWDRLSQDVFSYDRAVYGLQLSIRF